MITTRFGSEIEPLLYVGDGWFKVRRIESNTQHEWHVSEFKYDEIGRQKLESFLPTITPKLPTKMAEPKGA